MIGLSFLGANGLLNDVPLFSNLFWVENVSAAQGDTRNIEVKQLLLIMVMVLLLLDLMHHLVIILLVEFVCTNINYLIKLV